MIDAPTPDTHRVGGCVVSDLLLETLEFQRLCVGARVEQSVERFGVCRVDAGQVVGVEFDDVEALEHGLVGDVPLVVEAEVDRVGVGGEVEALVHGFQRDGLVDLRGFEP